MIRRYLLIRFLCSFTLLFTTLSSITDSASAISLSLSEFGYDSVRGSPYKVSWDNRALLVNGERVLIQSGSIHYPRSTPQMWPEIMKRTRDANLNTVQVYVFWNYHERSEGVYDFHSPNHDLLAFLRAAADAGLWVNLRIGPYVCSEWTYGGMPVWMRPDKVVVRTMNTEWREKMQRFVEYVTRLVEPYLPRNGGNVILAQIENEYGNIEGAYGQEGKDYVQWSAAMALNTSIDIPWIMCQQEDAPLTVINTVNGYYGDSWLPGHFQSRNQPGFWTENWIGWFQSWGEPSVHRPPEDGAFAIARFIMRGGVLHNFYMFHGGTTFGRWVGGPGIITSYDYDGPLDEYGVPHEPKYSHLTELHSILAKYSPAILANEVPSALPLGTNCEAYVYGDPSVAGSVAFLANIDSQKQQTVTWNTHSFTLPRWSVLIVDAQSGSVVYNTAVFSASTVEATTTAKIERERVQREAIKMASTVDGGEGPAAASAGAVAYIKEPLGGWQQFPRIEDQPVEQVDATLDQTDYLWYQTEVYVYQEQIDAGSIQLLLSSTSDFTYIYLDSSLIASTRSISSATNFTISTSQLQPGMHLLSFLSQTLGLENYGAHIEQWKRGLLGQIGWDEINIQRQKWAHTVGLEGEELEYWEVESAANGKWSTDNWSSHLGESLIWYSFNLTSPQPVSPLSASRSPTFQLDLSSLGKGFAFINGHNLGRYWNITGEGNCSPCDYGGSYDASKCRQDCGKPSQSMYHVPREWMRPVGEDNWVVIFEEAGGDPTRVQLRQRN